MSVLKSHITSSHTASHTTSPLVAATGEVTHTIDISGTHTGGAHHEGLESNGSSTSINEDLYREVRRYLGLI